MLTVEMGCSPNRKSTRRLDHKLAAIRRRDRPRGFGADRDEGADRGCECVGYQCHDHKGHEVPNLTMNDLVRSVGATGSIGVVGVFVPEDPGAKDKLAKKGQIAFDFGLFWFKDQRMATGQANVKALQSPTTRPYPYGPCDAVIYHFAQVASNECSGCLRTFRCPRCRMDQGRA